MLEWRGQLFRFLAKVALHIDAEQSATLFLAPALGLKDKLALSLIQPFANMVSRAGVVDLACDCATGPAAA